jgi:hypothetical protein
MRSDSDAVLLLRLAGPLRLLRRDGTDATPSSAKGRALLALLGTAPALRRSRSWIQDKLWSARAPGQGAASLRQTLHRLREAIGGDAGWLVSQAGWLALDPARVRVVLEPEPEDWDATGGPPEFCEGLDVADPEFEDWIRNFRLAYEDRLAEAEATPAADTPRLAWSSAFGSSPAPAVLVVLLSSQAEETMPDLLAALVEMRGAFGAAHFGPGPTGLAQIDGHDPRLVGALAAIRQAVRDGSAVGRHPVRGRPLAS